MDICVLPISGGGFPVQVASCCMLADVGYSPNVVFASSGGSICAFIMQASEWNSHKVPLIMEQLSSNLFAKKWAVPILTNLYSLCKGSIFSSGNGGEKLFATMFDAKKLCCTETWVGAYNTNLRKFMITTNMGRDNCILRLTESDRILNNLSPLCYADGDVSMMARYVSASCAIPGIVPYMHIDGYYYADGGVVSASPLSYFSKSMETCSRHRHTSFHYVCHTCEDLNAKEGGCYKSNSESQDGNQLIQGLIDIVSSMVSVSLVRDRVACKRASDPGSWDISHSKLRTVT